MRLDLLFILIIFFSFPGILSAFVFEKSTGKKQINSNFYFVNIIFLSCLIYLVSFTFILILSFFLECFNDLILDFANLNSLLELRKFIYNNLKLILICLSIVIGFTLFVAYLVAWIDYRDYLNRLSHMDWLGRFSKWFAISNRENDNDIWHNFIGKEIDRSVWVYIRDYKVSLSYRCRVYRFSDSEKIRELHLTDVTVFDSEENELYNVLDLYLCRDKNDISIEIPENTKKKEE